MKRKLCGRLLILSVALTGCVMERKAPDLSSIPIALQLNTLPAALLTSSPMQLIASVKYSDGSKSESNSQITWSADGAGVITESGYFRCTGVGDASVSVRLESLVSNSHTTCLNSPIPEPDGVFLEQSAEFFGPFPSWVNVKSVYGAAGDGLSDDTAALQAALNDQPRQHRVIWFPRGTYNISKSLSASQEVGLTIIGEDPASTIIRWVGAPGQVMLDLNGCTRLQISRLTFDGNNVADTAEHIWWSASLPYYYPTFNLLSDQNVKNTTAGIRIGFAGEITVERVHFDKQTSAAISEENFNAGNLWVRDSLFTDCQTGITNHLADGAGWFNVSNSMFVNSGTADILIGNTGPFSIRRSVSVNSRAFFISSQTGAPATVIFQANRIIGPATIPIQIGSPSPVLLLDNSFFRMKSTVPILEGTACCGLTDILSVGNEGLARVPFAGKIGRVKSVDDVFESTASDYPFDTPTEVYTPPPSSATVLEVPSGADATMIQSLVDRAARLPRGGIVHIPAGHFGIDKTLVIPKGGSVRLIGDGPFSTYLEGDASLSEAILSSESSNLFVAELQINQNSRRAGPTSHGMDIKIPDEPSTHVLLDEVFLQQDMGLLVDGIDQATVEVLSGQLNSQSLSQPASRLVGGAVLGRGAYGFGRINMFHAGTDFFDIDEGAQFLEEDFWHDGNEVGPAIDIHGGSGSITLSGASLHTPPSLSTITTDDFAGTMTLAGIQSTSALEIGQQSASSSVLLAASAIEFTESPVLGAASAGKIAGIVNANIAGNRPVSTSDFGETSPQWIEHMLGPVRTQHPRPRLPLENKAARIRIRRVYLASTATGIHIMPKFRSESVGPIGYSITSRNGDSLSSNSSSDCISEFPGNTGSEWTFAPSIDGGVNIQQSGRSISIAIPGTDQNLRFSDTALADARQQWIVLPAGDGFFRILNRVNGEALTSNGPGTCAVVSPLNGGKAQEWDIASDTL